MENTSKTQYVISLDAIDLNYLPTNTYKNYGITQIWKKQNIKQIDDEYYEFEIKEEIENEDDENSNQSTQMLPCHICNVNVPKIFFKDHLNSSKHGTFKEIINVSLERMKNVVSNELVNADTNLNESIYFCASCVAVVQTNEKVPHEDSLRHRHSLAVDKIVNGFLDLYKQNKPFDNDHAEMFGIIENENNKGIIKSQESSKSLATKINGGAIEYFKLLNNSMIVKGMTVLGGVYLELETDTGRKVRMSESHFHGIRRKSRTQYECFLCATFFKFSKKWDHLCEEGHLNRITKSFKNEHCMRPIDASWSHCAICNTIVHVQDQPEHTLDANHKLYLCEALRSSNGHNTHETQNSLDTRTYEPNIHLYKNDPNSITEECSKNYENDKTSIGTHFENNENNDANDEAGQSSRANAFNIRSTTEKPKAAAVPVANEISISPPLTRLDGDKKHKEAFSLAHQIALKRQYTCTNKERFFCAVCLTNIPNHNYSIYTHLTSAQHKESASELAKEDVVNLHYHIDLTKFPQLECFVCKKILPINNSHNITGHISGYIHKQNYQLMLNNNKIILRDDKYFCTICEILLDPMHELGHCQTRRHLDKLPPPKNCSPNVSCQDANNKSSTSTNTSQEDTPLKTYLLKEVDYKHRFCLVCNVKVPNNTNNIKSHLNGGYHNDTYKTILNQNKLCPVGNYFECKMCDSRVLAGGELQHIKQNLHLLLNGRPT